MLQVLLLILKILLWIILGLIGLVLLLLLLVLFAPIKYSADANMDENITVKAKIKYLIVSVLVNYNKNEKNVDTVIKIFGITLKKKDKPDKKKPKKIKKTKTKKVKESTKEETGASNIKNEEPEKSEEDIINDTSVEEPESSTADSYDLWDDEDDILEDDEKKLSGRAKKLAQGMADSAKKLNPNKIVSDIEEKKAKLDKKIQRFKKFWNMNCTVRTRAYLKKYIVGLLKHIAPKKIKGRLRYGFGDPAKTGQITGYMSLLPFVYQKDFSLEPDFYEKVIEGKIYLKGRIVLGYVVRIVLKKYIWQTIKMAKKI
ncbi:MAG: DUF2953 domain-containing protein [Lachnospiraceae bacterium]|nr:DUF2953 domain-containing protein [Lachnospiraceae bacterium]